MPLTAGNFASLLEPGLRRIFDIAISRPNPVMEALFGQEVSTKREEHYQAMGAFGLVPPWNGTVPYEDFAGGYKTTIRNYELASGITVERALIDDDQYGEIRRRCMSLGDSFRTTVEHDAAQIFINAFTDSGTNRMGADIAGADGVGLCSTAHPLAPANTGSTQANEGTYALSLDNVDTVRQAMLNYTDDKGNLMGVTPDMVLVPAELQRTAIQIFDAKAVYEPGSAEFNVNLFGGGLRVVMWNRLSDANAWWLIDSAAMRRNLIFQWRIKPEFAQAQDFDGMTAKFRGYMRYGIGSLDYRWVYGNNPA